MYKIDLPLKETSEGIAMPSAISEIKLRGDTSSIRMVTAMIISRIKYPGTIWANSDRGVVKLSEEKIAGKQKSIYTGKFYTTRNGLPGYAVESLQEDDQGNIWIGTKGGLSKLDPLTENITNYAKSRNSYVFFIYIFRCNAHRKRNQPYNHSRQKHFLW